MNPIKNLSVVLAVQLSLVSGVSAPAIDDTAIAAPAPAGSLAAAPSIAPNKQCVIDSFAAMDAQDYSRFRQLVPENAVFRFAGFPGSVGREVLVELLQKYRSSFPDNPQQPRRRGGRRRLGGRASGL